MVQPLQRTIRQLSSKLQIRLPFDPEIPSPGSCPTNAVGKQMKYVHTNLLTTELFVMTKDRK